MNVAPLSLAYFVHALEHRKPFAFARYGDGEFNAIFGTPGHNCDGHIYYTDMGAELAQTLTEPRPPPYVYGIGPKAARRLAGSVTRWLTTHAPRLEFATSETFVNASVAGELLPLMRTLQKKRILLVGGAHLKPVAAYLAATHITAPEKNAWLRKRALKTQIQNAAQNAQVVLFSAGMVSKILIWELAPHYPNTFLWDTGSLFDMYCGKDSRSYARRMSEAQKQALARQNFGELL